MDTFESFNKLVQTITDSVETSKMEFTKLLLAQEKHGELTEQQLDKLAKSFLISELEKCGMTLTDAYEVLVRMSESDPDKINPEILWYLEYCKDEGDT